MIGLKKYKGKEKELQWQTSKGARINSRADRLRFRTWRKKDPQRWKIHKEKME